MALVIFAMSFVSLIFSISEYPDWAIFIVLGLMLLFLVLGSVVEDRQDTEVRRLKKEVQKLSEEVEELKRKFHTYYL